MDPRQNALIFTSGTTRHTSFYTFSPEHPAMPCREVVNSRSIAWTVWYVAVSRSERREGVTRRTEERTKRDRRRRCDPRPRRIRIAAPLAAGWLCFECATERRRLVPVPPGWQRMSDRGLEELCARAIIMPKTARQLVTPRRRRQERLNDARPKWPYAALVEYRSVPDMGPLGDERKGD